MPFPFERTFSRVRERVSPLVAPRVRRGSPLPPEPDVELARLTDYPSPYPSGWYALARSSELRVGKLRVDPAARSVWVGDTEVELTGLELDILAALAKQAGEVIPRDRLLAAAGRSDVVVSERAIDVHISHLRQKLGEGVRIKTVRGVGYVLSREAPRGAPPREG